MLYRCLSCAGDLKTDGTGYKCIFCGTKYESEKELQIETMRSVNTEMRADVASVLQQSHHGADVFAANINGVLEITWSDSQYLHSGSGFLITADGYAVTNTHVVTHENGKSCGRVNVHIGGENTVADVIKLGDNRHGSGNGDDLALIKLQRVPASARVVKIADFNNVRIGERIFIIGNSLGYGNCITSGIVSDKLRNVNGKMLMMTDCAVNGGNSGGPVFNEDGLVIAAVVSGITDAEGMNFAIPATTILEFLKGSVNL